LRTSQLRKIPFTIPDPESPDHYFVVRNAIEALEAGRLELFGFCERHAVSAEAVNRLEVIFEELVSNAIRHGFSIGSAQSVHVRATAKPGLIEVTFEDDGRRFNPMGQPKPAPFTSLSEARLGGLGVALTLRLASSVRYEAPPVAGKVAAGRFRPRNRTIVTVSTAP